MTRVSGTMTRSGPPGPHGVPARWRGTSPFGDLYQAFSSEAEASAVWGPGVPTVLLVDHLALRTRKSVGPARAGIDIMPVQGLTLSVDGRGGTVAQPGLRGLLGLARGFTRDGRELHARVDRTEWTMRAVRRSTAELRRGGTPVVRSATWRRFDLLAGATPEDLALAVALQLTVGNAPFPLANMA